MIKAEQQTGTNVIYTLTYAGRVVGLNDYKSLHWRKLRQKYEPIKNSLTWLIIEAGVRPLENMELELYHNTNYDLDNLVGTVKPFVDALRNRKIIADDTKKYWDRLLVVYDPEVKKRCIKFVIIGQLKQK